MLEGIASRHARHHRSTLHAAGCTCFPQFYILPGFHSLAKEWGRLHTLGAASGDSNAIIPTVISVSCANHPMTRWIDHPCPGKDCCHTRCGMLPALLKSTVSDTAQTIYPPQRYENRNFSSQVHGQPVVLKKRTLLSSHDLSVKDLLMSRHNVASDTIVWVSNKNHTRNAAAVMHCMVSAY